MGPLAALPKSSFTKPRYLPHHFACNNSSTHRLQCARPQTHSSTTGPAHSSMYSRGIDPIACYRCFGSYKHHTPFQWRLCCRLAVGQLEVRLFSGRTVTSKTYHSGAGGIDTDTLCVNVCKGTMEHHLWSQSRLTEQRTHLVARAATMSGIETIILSDLTEL